jgi:hypothetical protein
MSSVLSSKRSFALDEVRVRFVVRRSESKTRMTKLKDSNEISLRHGDSRISASPVYKSKQKLDCF